jgi:hypothetical protein
MRHLLSLVLGLVLAPLIYIAAGYSAIKLDDSHTGGQLHAVPAVLGILAALIAGGLYALLVMARLSPVGPVLAGLLYLGITLWAEFGQSSFLDTIPQRAFGVDGLLRVPVGFGVILLAVPLLFTIFSPRRWRRFAQPAPIGFQAAPAYSTSPGDSAAPAYAPSTFTGQTYEPTGYLPPVYTPATSAAPTYAPDYAAATDYSPPAYVSPNEPTIADPKPADNQ